MIEKINDSAYFVVDERYFLTQIQQYDPTLASQTICSSSPNDKTILIPPTANLPEKKQETG